MKSNATYIKSQCSFEKREILSHVTDEKFRQINYLFRNFCFHEIYAKQVWKKENFYNFHTVKWCSFAEEKFNLTHFCVKLIRKQEMQFNFTNFCLENAWKTQGYIYLYKFLQFPHCEIVFFFFAEERFNLTNF